MEQQDLIQTILEKNEIESLKDDILFSQLEAYINNLILHHFDELIYVLYRVDVSEHKLKSLLKENQSTDAGKMIATLIIERQIQKIKSRQENRRDNHIVDDEEKW